MINEKEIQVLIQKASVELEELYCPIKKSKIILKYKDDGILMSDIMIGIPAMFAFMQILEFSSKAKMIHNDTNKELNRKERLLATINKFAQQFEFIVNQQLNNMDKENAK